MDRKELEEYRTLVVRYLEEHEKYKELLLQFSSVGQLEIGKPIPSPKRIFDAAAYKEITDLEKKLDKLRKEMIGAEKRYYEASHKQ
ncbi:MAG TPA: hypothetical protein VEG43_03640 [Dehalococcoidia bacterium]|nr:hypothetical protein [Dehalococcoidia bacterium]